LPGITIKVIVCLAIRENRRAHFKLSIKKTILLSANETLIFTKYYEVDHIREDGIIGNVACMEYMMNAKNIGRKYERRKSLGK
jgi:hypothetical protein